MLNGGNAMQQIDCDFEDRPVVDFQNLVPLSLEFWRNGRPLEYRIVVVGDPVSARQTQVKDQGVDHDRCGHPQGLIAVVLFEDVGDGFFGALAHFARFAEDGGGCADASDEGVDCGLYGVFGDGCIADEGGEVFEVSGDEALLREAVVFVV